MTKFLAKHWQTVGSITNLIILCEGEYNKNSLSAAKM